MFDEKNLPPGLEREDWDDFVAHRKEIGKPMTEPAKRRALMKLHRMREAGENLTQVIEQSMDCNWTGLWPVKRKENKPQAHQEAKKQDVPEVDEETARENVRYLHDALNGTMKITGTGR